MSSFGKMNWAGLSAYSVQPSDMELFQTYMKDYLSQVVAAQRSPGLIYGGRMSVVAGMQIQVSPGLALFPGGQLVKWDALTATLSNGNVSNPRFDRIEIAFAPVNNTSVTSVSNITEVLDILYVASINVVAGTPAATPTLPAQTSGNISIGYVQVPTGASSLLTGNLNQIIGSGYQVSEFMLGDKNSFIRFNQLTGQLQYSNDGSRYQAFGSGGGGGGGGAVWQPVAGIGAVESFEFDEKCFLFTQGAGQALSIYIKVPSAYLSGGMINMKLAQYSPGTANNFKLQTVTTLIRNGVDAVTSTANQYTSTNGDLISSTANLLQTPTYDLTAAGGLVNGVLVSPLDILKVQLQRVTPAGAEDLNDVRMIPNAMEVLFS